jgi:hypothetical protein
MPQTPLDARFLLIDKTHNPTLKPFLSINKNRAVVFAPKEKRFKR